MTAAAFTAFKYAVYALLACNVLLFALHGTLAETVDTAAWVLLLLLFEWETGRWAMPARARRPVHALRLLAAVAIVWAWGAYGFAGEWLDFANASVWLAVVAALELEVRMPAARVRLHALRRAVTVVLYASLAAFALAWGLAGEWLDAWDAWLWIVAFLVIELNVFRFGTPAADAATQGA